MDKRAEISSQIHLLAYQNMPKDKADDLTSLLQDYATSVKKSVSLGDVSNQRELLIAFIESHHEKHHYSYPVSEIDVNEYLSNKTD